MILKFILPTFVKMTNDFLKLNEYAKIRTPPNLSPQTTIAHS